MDSVRPTRRRPAERARRAQIVLLWGLGAVAGVAIRSFENRAVARVEECDVLGIDHEFESFRRVSGTASENAERTWWLQFATLYTTEPSLGLRSTDLSVDENTIELQEPP